MVANTQQVNHETGNPNIGIERIFISLDKHGDGKLTPDEWPQPIEFKLADTNNDGFVTLEEYITFEVKMRSPDFALEVRFKEMDKKGDGKLTADEFQPASQFALVDRNKQGFVTLDEYKAYYAKIAQQAAARDAGLIANFKKLDTKGDGKLTPDEWPDAVRFKMADTHGDGVVTQEEYIAFEKKIRNPEAFSDLQFHELDKKGDGKLTAEEWPQRVRFKMADSDGDGFVSRLEYLAFQKKLRSPDFRLEIQFKELDKKGDGKLTADEFGNAALFAKIDKDNTGAVTFDMYKAYMMNGH